MADSFRIRRRWVRYRYLPYAVKGFFDNLGERAYIVRVLAGGNATANDNGAPVSSIERRLTQDALAASTVIRVNSTQSIDTTVTIGLQQVKNGITTSEGPYKVTAYNDATGDVTLNTALVNTYGSQYTIVTITPAAAPPGTKFQLVAEDPGAWGNDISVQIRPSSKTFSQRADNNNLTGGLDTVPLASARNFYIGAIVEFNTGSVKHWRKVKDIQGSSIIVDTPFALNTDLNVDGGAPAGFTRTTVSTCEFDLDGIVERRGGAIPLSNNG